MFSASPQPPVWVPSILELLPCGRGTGALTVYLWNCHTLPISRWRAIPVAAPLHDLQRRSDDSGSRGVGRLPMEKVYERCLLLAQSMGGVAMVEIKEIHPKG